MGSSATVNGSVIANSFEAGSSAKVVYNGDSSALDTIPLPDWESSGLEMGYWSNK